MKKKFLLLLLVTFAVFLALLVCQRSYCLRVHLKLLLTPRMKEADVMSAYENVLSTTVRIQGNGYYGSGSIWEMRADELIIVTGRHVLTGFDEESYVTFFNGRIAKAEILGISETEDVGFLSVSTEGFSERELLNYRMVRAAEEQYDILKKNDEFFMIDIASNIESPVYYKGGIVDKSKYLKEYQVEMLYGDGYAVAGMSGCGIFDEKGNYIAMLSGKTQQGEVAAVPITTIFREYEKIKNQFT